MNPTDLIITVNEDGSLYIKRPETLSPAQQRALKAVEDLGIVGTPLDPAALARLNRAFERSRVV
jgi:hypothetical protein